MIPSAASAEVSIDGYCGRGRGVGGCGCCSCGGLGRGLLHFLFEMDFGVTLLFVGSSEFSPANVAREGLLARVSANVGREVIRTGE